MAATLKIALHRSKPGMWQPVRCPPAWLRAKDRKPRSACFASTALTLWSPSVKENKAFFGWSVRKTKLSANDKQSCRYKMWKHFLSMAFVGYTAIVEPTDENPLSKSNLSLELNFYLSDVLISSCVKFSFRLNQTITMWLYPKRNKTQRVL